MNFGRSYYWTILIYYNITVFFFWFSCFVKCISLFLKTISYLRHSPLIEIGNSFDQLYFTKYSWLQKKTGNENFHNVNLVLSIGQLFVYLTIPIK
jgi:hypothetical protein